MSPFEEQATQRGFAGPWRIEHWADSAYQWHVVFRGIGTAIREQREFQLRTHGEAIALCEMLNAPS